MLFFANMRRYAGVKAGSMRYFASIMVLKRRDVNMNCADTVLKRRDVNMKCADTVLKRRDVNMQCVF
jgi:hypothetical protein